MSNLGDFPAPEATDPEDVIWPLQTAQTMWERRDVAEAVRWLRRAAEAASDAGNDLRALALARFAADLTQAHQLAFSEPPVSRDSIVPADDALSGETDLTIPEGYDAAELPHRSSPRAAPPPLRRSSPHAAPPPVRPAPPRSPAPEPLEPELASSPSASAQRSSPSTAPGPNVRPRQTWRVAVELAPVEMGGLWVRPLAEDEALPQGSHEALLTALEPGAHLLSKKR